LIAGPLRVARKVWTDEIAEWSHLNGLTTSVMCGSAEERIAALNTPADIHLINHENIPWLCKQHIRKSHSRIKVIRPWQWDTIVLDESDWYKSSEAQRYKWLNRIRRMNLCPRMIQLTGTPTPQDYQDLWSQIKLLDNGERLGFKKTAFQQRWTIKTEYGYKREMRPYAELEIKKLIEDIVVSLRSDDYLDLPPVLNNFIRVSMSRKAKALYDELEREFIVELVPDKVVTAVNGGALYGKLLQMAGGAVYRALDEIGNRETLWLHNEKIAALIETLQGLRGPVIIAYGFQHERDRIEAALAKYEPKKVARRLKSVKDENDWNEGKIDRLLLHPKSGGHGLNLQFSGSENIIWFGPTPNRGLYDQLNARLAGGHRRVGKNICIHHIICEDTIDMFDVIPRLDHKGERQDRIMQLLSAKVREVWATR